MRSKRIEKLRESFEEEKIDGLLVTNPLNIRYLTGFVGLTPSEREAYVLVTKHKVFLITDGRYIEQAKEQIEQTRQTRKFNHGQNNARALFCPSETTTKRSWFCPLTILEIKPRKEIVKLLHCLMAKLKIKRLGFEANDLTLSEHQKLNNFKPCKKARDRLGKRKVYHLAPTKDLVENLRAIKEPEEIKKIKKAVKITDQCFKNLLKFLKPGLTEKIVAWEIEKFIQERGADLAFKPIVASGPNSAIPHHVPPRSYKLKAKSLVLIDFGAQVDGYCSDMTRVVFLGKATEAQKKIYISVLKAQKKALSFLTQSSKVKSKNYSDKVENPRQSRDNSKVKTIEAKEIDKVARNYLKNSGFPEIPHSLGHGVGLAEHELPRLSPKSKDVLKPGMVFTIEPGVYLPGKFGIRIEDLVLLKRNKVEVLTKSPKKIVEI